MPRLVLSMRLLEDEYLLDIYALTHNIPGNSGLLGQIFEAIAHRVIPGKEVLQSTPMDTNGEIPPTFSTTASQPPPTSPRDTISKSRRRPTYSRIWFAIAPTLNILKLFNLHPQ